MKGVPWYATDEEIQADEKRLDEHATTIRLFKDERKLRTVHIQFQNELQFDKAIQDALRMASILSLKMYFANVKPLSNAK